MRIADRCEKCGTDEMTFKLSSHATLCLICCQREFTKEEAEAHMKSLKRMSTIRKKRFDV